MAKPATKKTKKPAPAKAAPKKTAAKQAVVTAAPALPVLVSYKGFDKDLQCRGFQFEIGKTYTAIGKIEACQNGFHACENPLDVLSYYGPGTSRFAIVEQGGTTARHDKDTKIASATITIKAELSLPDFIRKGAARIIAAAKGNTATGIGGHAATTGYYGHAAATGIGGHAATTGDYGHAAATGDSGHAATTGYYGHAAATGDSGHAAATGDSGHAATTGYYGHAAATGIGGHAAATGYSGHAAATGIGGHAAATGYSGHAAATGYSAVASACGIAGRAKAGPSGAIMLACISEKDRSILAVRASKVGENGVKANCWYRLSAEGAFIEVED